METSINLAQLISQILGEGVYAESTAETSDSTILSTAFHIQADIEAGILSADEDGNYWNPEMIDNYGGLIDQELEAGMPEGVPYCPDCDSPAGEFLGCAEHI